MFVEELGGETPSVFEKHLAGIAWWLLAGPVAKNVTGELFNAGSNVLGSMAWEVAEILEFGEIDGGGVVLIILSVSCAIFEYFMG